MGKEYIRRVSIVGESPIAGEIVIYDGFEDLFKWISTGDGNGAATKDNTLAFTANASMKLLSDSGAPAEDQAVAANIRAMVIPGAIYDFQLDFRFQNVTHVKSFLFYVDYQTPSDRVIMGLNFLPGTPQWQYRSTDAAWATLTGMTQTIEPTYWNRIAFGLNLNTGAYIDCILNDQTYDLSMLSSTKSATTRPPSTLFYIEGACAGANQIWINIDNYLIQQRSP